MLMLNPDIPWASQQDQPDIRGTLCADIGMSEAVLQPASPEEIEELTKAGVLKDATAPSGVIWTWRTKFEQQTVLMLAHDIELTDPGLDGLGPFMVVAVLIKGKFRRDRWALSDRCGMRRSTVMEWTIKRVLAEKRGAVIH